MLGITSRKSSIKMDNYRAVLQGEKTLASVIGSTNERRTVSLFAYRRWKDILDRLFSLLVIIILSPLLVLIALMIWLESRGSPIHSRKQVGQGGKAFTAYKFRTMYVDKDDKEYKSYLVRYIQEDAPYTIAQNGQALYKIVGDARVTKFGSLLRKTNLDELPQLFNILKGEMSLIGPRPDIPFAVAMYKDWHRQRLIVKPGITGLWQVSGRKGLSFNDMVGLDIEYIREAVSSSRRQDCIINYRHHVQM